jgi:CBS domain containing-hemolysin-like protein
MIFLAVSAVCYVLFLIFETFALALERLSTIRLRGLLEEHPERARLLAGPGEIEITRTTTKVFVQILLLTGLLTVVHGISLLGVTRPWAWGGGAFFLGWLLTEIVLIKSGSRRDPERTVARLLPFVNAASWLLLPLAAAVRKIFESRDKDAAPPPPATEEEVQAYIDVGREEGILDKGEEKLLLSIVDFGDTRVREVMTPRTDIVSIDEAASPDQLADLFVATKYSRIPVVRGSIDKVAGVVHVKDLFDSLRRGGPGAIGRILRQVYFVPESKKVSELLREFQRRHLWLAVVVDEYGGVSGLVTVEDLLEEIVGEIWDEHEDERESIATAGESGYSISGKENVEIIRELFGRGPEEGEFTSIGGFLAARLGHIPRPGETFREFELLFTVEEADRRRVYRVRVEPTAPDAAAAATASEGRGGPASPAASS